MAVSAPPGPSGAANVPPHNHEAEVSVLGAILIGEKMLDRLHVEVRLRPDDFYRDRHRLIFKSMLRLKEKQSPEPVDVLTVCEELQRSGQLDEAGGRDYVHSLPSAVASPGNAPHYAKIVREHALMRRLLAASRDIQERVLSHRGDPQDMIDQAEADLFKIAHEDKSGDLRSVEEVLADELDKLQKVSQAGQELTGTPSGFRDLDGLTGGFQPGNLIVLAARPSMGKSALVTNIAENASIKSGKAIALFSLEMSETELAQRFIASQAKIDGDDLRKGRVKPDRWPRVLQAAEKLAAAPLFIDDSSDIGIHELRAKARRLHARHPLGLVILDYLQLMRPEDPSVGRVEQVGQMSRGLKILARELEVPVIAVSQLSRAVESRTPKIPMLSDLRESGNVEQDADVVVFIYRDEYYNKESSERIGEADLLIEKHRNGPVGKVTLAFTARFPKFSSLAYRDDPAGPSHGNGGDPGR
ncbi:MAG TPA: replicative DNA helicase [Thermoleophilaceae bacterium]|nr:replicative DNA helicase [Thermoleophilaceae bacterium]